MTERTRAMTGAAELLRFGTLGLLFLGVFHLAAQAKRVQKSAKAVKIAAAEVARQAGSGVNSAASAQRPLQPSDDQRAARYQVAAQHYISGNEILWAYLYYYFVGASVLALAWSSVFAARVPGSDVARDLILATLASAGIGLSGIWLLLLRRANSYRRPLFQAAPPARSFDPRSSTAFHLRPANN